MNTDFRQAVATVLEVAPSELDERSNSDSVSTWDSLMHWTLISELEGLYEVDFTMDEAASFEVLGDLHDALVARGVLPVEERAVDAAADFPLTQTAIRHVTGRFGFLAKGIDAAYALDKRRYLERSERVLSILNHQAGGTDAGYREALDGFIKLSLEYLKLQEELRRTGRYHFASFDEARNAVYDNPAVMEQYYLHGVLASSVMWKNHYDVLCFFHEGFLPRLEGAGRNLEVGCGHGYFTGALLEAHAGWRTTAVDISPYSRAYTERTLRFLGVAEDRWELLAGNIHELPFESDSQDAVVCGELLEHVEDPTHALAELRRVCRPGGRAWMTTAIYAANLDHIHLFRSVEEVREMIAKAGWRVETERILDIEQPWVPGTLDTPFSYAAILR